MALKLIDLNLLLYAINRDAPQHERARDWVEATFTDEDGVGLAWVVVLGFVRLSTSRRVFSSPLAPAQALDIVDGWLSRPTVQVLSAGPEHWRLLKELFATAGTAGNLTTDVHLAALAIEHGADVYSTDADFARFQRLRWVNPLA